MSSNIRDLTIDELKSLLASKKAARGNRFIAADELHKRGCPLPISKDALTLIARSLSKAEQQHVYANANQLTLSSVQLIEWVRYGRGEEIRKWAFSAEGHQEHRLDLADLVYEMKMDEGKAFVWNEWMPDWKEASTFRQWLKEQPFRFNESQTGHTTHQTRTEDKPFDTRGVADGSSLAVKRGGSWSVLLGVLALMAVPFWITMVFTAIASGYATFLGPILPVVFSLVMSAMSIPVAIGLFQRKKWAWGFYVYSTLMALVWFGGHFIIDDAGRIWLAMTVFAGIILTFATIAKDDFQ